jgi:hypothetical protein
MASATSFPLPPTFKDVSTLLTFSASPIAFAPSMPILLRRRFSVVSTLLTKDLVQTRVAKI